MIAKARAVSHGSAYTTYATLKPNQQMEKDKKPLFVCSENMAGDMTSLLGKPDLNQVWEQFKYAGDGYLQRGKPVTRTLVCAEVSPSAEESLGWTMDDWDRLAHDFVHRMDQLEFSDKRGKISAKKTDYEHSKWLAMLHVDSKSGIPHLHVMMSRFTVDGRLNDANLIGIKAVTVANQINREMGWRQSADIRTDHVAKVKDTIYDLLRSMDHFSWDSLQRGLEERGYGFQLKRDNSDRVVSYQVWQGRSKFTASEIGRELTAKRIEGTWQRLHDEQAAFEEKHHFSCDCKRGKGRGKAHAFGKHSTRSVEQGYVHYESDLDRGHGEGKEHFTFDFSPRMDDALWKAASAVVEVSAWTVEQIIETTIHVFFKLVVLPGLPDGGPTYSSGGGQGEDPAGKKDNYEEELLYLARVARVVAMAHPKVVVKREWYFKR